MANSHANYRSPLPKELIEKKKILFVIHNLLGGGSEKVFLTLLSKLNRDLFEPHLLLVQNKISYDLTAIKDVPIYFLNTRGRYSIFKMYKEIRAIKPDIVFSTLAQINLMIAFLGIFKRKNQKYIARESSIVSIRNKDELLPKLFHFLFKTIYKNLDAIICQGTFMSSDLIKNYNIKRSKIHIINNPLEIQKIRYLGERNVDFSFEEDKIHLVFVGHLNDVKRPHIALKLIKELNDKQKFHLHLVGTGEQEKELRQFVIDNNLSEQVTFWGFLKNPYAVIQKCDCLLSVSRYEGFPNVVLEANLLGLPVLAYNYPGGIEEIIVEGLNGQLIENNNFPALLKTLEKFDKSLYDSKKIEILTAKKYDSEKIVQQYESIFLAT